ncbi:hypothetical protein [Methylicorpusculum sp.]|uniref:hypothetical protein n=1 Tax=Methylicorpusculum sp. TaxID=2713644 RepID=UPI00273502CE|nr:hypothetical protein [Methylicorpusculum sp.]
MKVPGVKERAVTRPTGRREYVHVGLTAAPCRRHLSIEQPLPLRFVYFHGNVHEGLGILRQMKGHCRAEKAPAASANAVEGGCAVDHPSCQLATLNYLDLFSD